MTSRRKILKAGLLTLGGTTLLPYLSPGEIVPKAPFVGGRLQFSPFYGEYVPDSILAKTPLRARLNANENPYGPSPSAIEAIKNVASKGNLYDWEGIEQLTAMIASKEGLKPENVLIGPGSTDFLEKSGMLFFKDGGEMVTADPTFMTIIRTAQAVGADWKNIPLKSDWSHDLKAMSKAVGPKTKLVYLCNPNNPTGTLTDTDSLLQFAKTVSDSVPVFVDEAYLDFMPDNTPSLAALIGDGKNVLVARTFSKIYGMAGLRIGYLLGQPDTLKAISDCSFTGMGISNTSIAAAMASLSDTGFIQESRDKNAQARRFTYDQLKNLGYEPVVSHTSFMIFPIRIPGEAFSKKMYEQGIGIRTLRIHNRDWCRVSIGTMDSMQIFIDGLRTV